MIHMIQKAKDQAAELAMNAYRKAVADGALPDAEIAKAPVEIPKDTKNGDFTTTFALAASKVLRQPPRAIAQALLERLALTGSYFDSAEIAGPGFLNFHLGQAWFRDVLCAVETEGDGYGTCDDLTGRKIMAGLTYIRTVCPSFTLSSSAAAPVCAFRTQVDSLRWTMVFSPLPSVRLSRPSVPRLSVPSSSLSPWGAFWFAPAAGTASMNKVISEKHAPVVVESLHARYPQGGEKQLCQAITGKQVPPGGLPSAIGCAVFNINTTCAIYRAITEGMPVVRKVVTVSGSGVIDPKNLECPIGTPVANLLDACGGVKEGTYKLIAGGPM